MILAWRVQIVDSFRGPIQAAVEGKLLLAQFPEARFWSVSGLLTISHLASCLTPSSIGKSFHTIE
jgi:hypothetical protein